MQLDNKELLNQIEELATILKQWNDQLVVGGGVALILYDLILSKANSGAVGTTDIDYLIPRKPIKAGDVKISDLLVGNGYEAKNKSLGTPAVQSFIKHIEEIEIEVEFLTGVSYLDILGGFSPKGSSDDIQTSNYVNVGANVGVKSAEDLSFEFGSTYFKINSTDTIDARTSYALGVTLQKDLSNNLFIRGAIGYFITGDEKYSNSTDKISYDPSTEMQLSLGFNKEGTSIDWLVSYQGSFGSNSAKFKLSNVDYSGDSTSSLVMLGAGYSF